MKIKRAHYEKMQNQIRDLERVAETRLVVGSVHGDLMDATFSMLAISARFGGDSTELIQGPITVKLIAPNLATGYEHFLVRKYGETPDPPFNVFGQIKIADRQPSTENT